MSNVNALLASLESLDETVLGLEQALAKWEARPKSRRGAKDQMDLFGGAAVSAVPNVDTDELTTRINRAIAQIETVLSAHKTSTRKIA